MQVQPNIQLDPVSLLLLIFTSILGPQLAPAASAYSIIALGSFVGLLIGVRRREPTSRMGTLAYSVVTVITAMVMTIWISQFLGPRLPGGGGDWLYFPVALMTTAFGEYWMNKLQDFTGTLLALFTPKERK